MTQTSGFVLQMHGCREILRLTPSAIVIQQQIEAIEQSVSNNPSYAIDIAKALVETVCKTILSDRRVSVEGTPDAPALFRLVLDNLQLMPGGQSGSRDTRDALKKTMNGLQTAVQGLAELRNLEGFASHGKDAYAASIEAVQAMLAAQAADAIVYFLYSVHRKYQRNPQEHVIRYEDEDSRGFNEYIDQAHELIVIFELSYKPSEVLFRVDEDAYRVAFADYLNQPADDEDN